MCGNLCRWTMLAAVRVVPVALLLVGVAWAGDAARPAAPEDIAFFEARIRPLLVKHCYRCHSDSAKALKGGLKLDGAEGLLKGGDSGAVLVAHKPDESSLIEAVKYTNADLQM